MAQKSDEVRDFSKIGLEIMSSNVYIFGGEWSAALALSAIYPFRGCDGSFVFCFVPVYPSLQKSEVLPSPSFCKMRS